MLPIIQAILDAPSAAAAPDFKALRAALAPVFPLLDDLADTPQDPSWHAEGDVATHTEWVMQEAAALADTHALAPLRRLSLVLSALLHDIAKPLTTCEQVIEGRTRIVAPHHAQTGRNWLACRLLDLGLPYPILREVLALVGTHHEPKKLVIKGAPSQAYARLALHADLPLLHLLVQADMRGRACDDKQGQLDLIELFYLEAASYNLTQAPHQPPSPWTTPWFQAIACQLPKAPPEVLEYTTANGLRDFLAGTIFTPEEAVARSFERRKQGIGEVVLTCGPSGAGKSQWIAKHLPDHQLISLDELRLELTGDVEDQSANGQVLQLARERLRAALRTRRPVVWDSTSLRLSFRSAILDLARAYGLHTTLVTFHLTPQEYAARNRARTRQVPVSIIEKQIKGFEWPLPLEADRALFIDAQGAPLYDSREALWGALNTSQHSKKTA